MIQVDCLCGAISSIEERLIAWARKSSCANMGSHTYDRRSTHAPIGDFSISDGFHLMVSENQPKYFGTTRNLLENWGRK